MTVYKVKREFFFKPNAIRFFQNISIIPSVTPHPPNKTNIICIELSCVSTSPSLRDDVNKQQVPKQAGGAKSIDQENTPQQKYTVRHYYYTAICSWPWVCTYIYIKTISIRIGNISTSVKFQDQIKQKLRVQIFLPLSPSQQGANF